MASQTKLLFPSQAHSSCSLSHIRKLQLHSPRYPGSSTWSHPLYHSLSKPPVGTLGFKLCLEMNNSYHLHHHSRLTTITSLLAHCNIRLTDLLFSFQPESSFKTIPDHVTPLLKSLQRIPILCSVKPKAFPRPQGPTGWTQCLSDLRACRSPPHLPCSRGFSATPATLLPRGLCLPFPLPAPLLLLLSTWLTVGVGILKTEPIGCLDV